MMGWTPPTALMCQGEGVEHHLREGSVSEAIGPALRPGHIRKPPFSAPVSQAIFANRKLLKWHVKEKQCTRPMSPSCFAYERSCY